MKLEDTILNDGFYYLITEEDGELDCKGSFYEYSKAVSYGNEFYTNENFEIYKLKVVKE